MKQLILIFLFFLLAGCASYPVTSFYVKNISDKAIGFDATVMKHSQSLGRYTVDQSFFVKPGDSVLARRIGFKTDGTNPQNWFTNFNINPVDGLTFNDPRQAENWKKAVDKNGKPIFTFTLTK